MKTITAQQLLEIALNSSIASCEGEYMRVIASEITGEPDNEIFALQSNRRTIPFLEEHNNSVEIVGNTVYVTAENGYDYAMIFHAPTRIDDILEENNDTEN